MCSNHTGVKGQHAKRPQTLSELQTSWKSESDDDADEGRNAVRTHF